MNPMPTYFTKLCVQSTCASLDILKLTFIIMRCYYKTNNYCHEIYFMLMPIHNGIKNVKCHNDNNICEINIEITHDFHIKKTNELQSWN